MANSNSHYKFEGSNLSIIEAVETLSSIADLEIDKEVGITQQHDLVIQDKKFNYKTVNWLHKQDAEKTVEDVKETFRVILNYLRNFYKKEYSYVTDQKAIEGIKTIMVLVGEAAKKLDRYTSLFKETKQHSIMQLKEYKKLQEFYLTHIDRIVDEGVLGKWILGLTKRAMSKKKDITLVGKLPPETRHVFVDLEAVKKDTEYELFFIRKEDGSRFFNPRLIRNIKLVCDFENIFGPLADNDPLIDLHVWQDRSMQSAARSILRSLGSLTNRFYRDSARFREREIVVALNNALMALMLCSNPRNLTKNLPMKSSYDYFLDFLRYLHEALQSPDYHKSITYPQKVSKLGRTLLHMVHALSKGYYVSMLRFHDFNSMVSSLIQEANSSRSEEHLNAAQAKHEIWSRLAGDYAAMVKLMKRHPNGPLDKVLNVLEEGSYQAFDPEAQLNLPSQLYAIGAGDHRIMNLHIPAPTHQEYINKVKVIELFKAFLRSISKDHFHKKHLLINLQDRTSWREHSRCHSLENLTNHDEFNENIAVVTLAKDTEFYHQMPPYHQNNHAEVFLKSFKEHLGDESSGYFFTPQIKKAISGGFIDGVFAAIHRIFFSNKNILLRDHRLDFIEIFDLFLTLKLLDIVKPDSFSLTCKDGVDIGASSSALIFAFMKMLNQGEFSQADWQQLNTLIYTPALIVRERMMLPDRFNRMLNALKTIEYVYQEHGPEMFAKIIREAFGSYYKGAILEGVIIPAKE